jgi:hypothetical protein
VIFLAREKCELTGTPGSNTHTAPHHRSDCIGRTNLLHRIASFVNGCRRWNIQPLTTRCCQRLLTQHRRLSNLSLEEARRSRPSFLGFPKLSC